MAQINVDTRKDGYCPSCGALGDKTECLSDCELTHKKPIREPYTYSLPENFLLDKAVPARWRVWAVINGFFINGGYCWASNDWIAERLGIHKDTVSQAIKELEENKVIRCSRGARSRSVFPMIGGNTYHWSAPTPISDRHQRLSNSVKNSEKETSVAPLREIVVDSEEEMRPRSKPKYPNAREAASWLPFTEPSWFINTTELKHLELLFSRGEKAVKSLVRFIAKHKDDPYCPKFTKPSDLERKWRDYQDYADKND